MGVNTEFTSSSNKKLEALGKSGEGDHWQGDRWADPSAPFGTVSRWQNVKHQIFGTVSLWQKPTTKYLVQSLWKKWNTKYLVQSHFDKIGKSETPDIWCSLILTKVKHQTFGAVSLRQKRNTKYLVQSHSEKNTKHQIFGAVSKVDKSEPPATSGKWWPPSVSRGWFFSSLPPPSDTPVSSTPLYTTYQTHIRHTAPVSSTPLNAILYAPQNVWV